MIVIDKKGIQYNTNDAHSAENNHSDYPEYGDNHEDDKNDHDKDHRDDILIMIGIMTVITVIMIVVIPMSCHDDDYPDAVAMMSGHKVQNDEEYE